MGTSCTVLRDVKREETADDIRRHRERQRDIHQARCKAMQDYNRRENESGTSLEASIETSSVGSWSVGNISWAGGSFVSEVLLTEQPPAVICFTSEIEPTDAPALMARDHMGRQVEVLVPHPSARHGDDDRFVPFFHPHSPLSREAVQEFDAIKSTGSSRRLRFLEKSEDVEDHLKRMAPVKKVGA